MIKKGLKYLDPYHYMDLFIDYLHKNGIKNKILDFIIYTIYSILLALLILKILSLITGTNDAMMIVVSGSMEPKINVGDIVVLKRANIEAKTIIYDGNLDGKSLTEFATIKYTNRLLNNSNQINTKGIEIFENFYEIEKSGDIITYYSENLKRDIIHRVIYKIIANDGTYYITKGDNENTNTIIDQDCSLNFAKCIKDYPIKESEVKGEYLFKIPYLGLIKVIPFKLLGLA